MPTGARRPGALLTALAVVLLATPAAPAGEAYYLLVFGSQRIPNNPNYSHSFAAFVRARWPDGCMFPAGAEVDYHVISWLPATLKIRTLALCPEEGVNLPLHETIRLAMGTDQRISMWGPYQIDPELYALAERQRGRLESGEVRYKANDVGYNSARVTNCIHALSNVVEGGRLRVATPGWGETASYSILRRYLPFVPDCGRVHPWVVYALGLQRYPIIYRDLQAPRSGGIIGPFYRLFGGERALFASFGPPE